MLVTYLSCTAGSSGESCVSCVRLEADCVSDSAIVLSSEGLKSDMVGNITGVGFGELAKTSINTECTFSISLSSFWRLRATC